MNRSRRALWLTLLLLALAGLALLAMGALKLRRDFLTRGIPAGFPQPIAHSGTQLGLNVALTQYQATELDQNLRQIADLGVTAVKQPFYYSEEFDWATSDGILAAVGAHDLELVPLLDGDPGREFAPPADPTPFATWAGQFAARYADLIRYYVIWDEPNLASHWGDQPVNANEYAALLTAAAQAIRAADPDAVIVAAPLAPTSETGPDNLADALYLQQLYEAGAAGAFDVVAGKPYGFDTGPDDRRVGVDVLNFSRIILLREVMVRNGDGHKPVWAGNWGWNALPPHWQGAPSVWGQTTPETQAAYTVAALERARQEWPWLGLMFLENWEPVALADDPRRGFSISGRETARALTNYLSNQQTNKPTNQLAYPGFHLAQNDKPAQTYDGTWRFSPEYGADIGQSGDRATFRFWGTGVALRVRRADYRARLYVEVDGEPANALPQDGTGAALVLSSPDPAEDYLSIEPVAQNLAPGPHTLTLLAERGWDQWALNGFSVAYHRPGTTYTFIQVGLGLVLLAALVFTGRVGRQTDWGMVGRVATRFRRRFSDGAQLALTGVAAVVVALAGWLTWGEQAAGLYRRLGDGPQLALTAATASVFYVAPSFFVTVAALVILFLLIYARPGWGIALVAFSFPFYVEATTKPMLGYRFSPVEVFTLVTGVAFFARWVTEGVASGNLQSLPSNLRSKLVTADIAVAALVAVATLSLFFTERVDVALNEWRMVVVEPALFYLLLRAARLSKKEMWVVLDAFILSGVAVALYGLWQYVQGENVITVASGLGRLRSFYGSPNNVALYLGRVLPFPVAMALLGKANGRRRWTYALALLPLGAALLLTFSKGAFFLGLPAGLALIFLLWGAVTGRRVWPWLAGLAGASLLAILIALNVPLLAGRLNVQGYTSVLRLNLWRSSLNMIADHPLTGVGLDNFLYAYRGRYILDAAWEEPDLNHPHNLVLDFTTRLGLLGLLAGMWLFWSLGKTIYRLARHITAVPPPWQPVVAALAGAFGHIVAHGLVDHSFFIVDLAFAFYLLLGTAIWIEQNVAQDGAAKP